MGFNCLKASELPQGDSFPINNFLLNINKRNIGKRCEICSKLTIKTPTSYWCFYCKL